jgi:hypothetical protein
VFFAFYCAGIESDAPFFAYKQVCKFFLVNFICIFEKNKKAVNILLLKIVKTVFF